MKSIFNFFYRNKKYFSWLSINKREPACWSEITGRPERDQVKYRRNFTTGEPIRACMISNLPKQQYLPNILDACAEHFAPRAREMRCCSFETCCWKPNKKYEKSNRKYKGGTPKSLFPMQEISESGFYLWLKGLAFTKVSGGWCCVTCHAVIQYCCFTPFLGLEITMSNVKTSEKKKENLW